MNSTMSLDTLPEELSLELAPLRAGERIRLLHERLGDRAARDPVEMEAAAVDYLQFTGHLCLAWCWAKMAAVAIVRLKQQPADAGFYEAKLATARFYFARLLPRAEAHVDAIAGGAGPLLALPADRFRF